MRTALLLLAALLCSAGGTGAMAATELYFELAGDVGPCDVTGVDVNAAGVCDSSKSQWTVTLQTTEGAVTITARCQVYYVYTTPLTLPWVRVEEMTVQIVSPNGTQTATEPDASGSAVSVVVHQDGADVAVSVSSDYDTLTDTITGATLQRNRPAAVLLVANSTGGQGTPSCEAGPCELTWEGSVRAYDWTEIRDWSWSPRVVPLTDGRIVPAGTGIATGFSATWSPLWGPVTWQAGPGVPVWRLALTRINSDEAGWNWQTVRAQNQADLGAGFATVATNTEVSSLFNKPNHGCAWVVDNGTVYVALEILTVSDTGQSGIYVWRQRPTNGLGSPVMDDIYEGYSPQALLLKPSQDVLLFYLDAESNVLAWRLVYWPDTSPPYSIEEAEPYDLGVTALSLGQPWLTEGGQVGLPYTDLDGNVQTIYGDASGTTWAP